MRRVVVALFFSLMGGCAPPDAPDEARTSSGWQSVYKHDEEGRPIRGDKSELIRAVRAGYDVRVGWGWERTIDGTLVRLEHMAEPLFLTIVQGEHVSVVIDAHPLLESYIDIDQQVFGEGGDVWQTTLTTNGAFNAQVFDRATGELARDWPQRHQMTWYVEYPPGGDGGSSVPLYEKR